MGSWLANHDVKLMFRFCASQLDLLDDFEAQLSVYDRIDGVAGLEIACSALEVGHRSDVLDELARVALATSRGFGTDIDKVPSAAVSILPSLLSTSTHESPSLLPITSCFVSCKSGKNSSKRRVLPSAESL